MTIIVIKFNGFRGIKERSFVQSDIWAIPNRQSLLFAICLYELNVFQVGAHEVNIFYGSAPELIETIRAVSCGWTNRATYLPGELSLPRNQIHPVDEEFIS